MMTPAATLARMQTNNPSSARLGIDIGRVIIGGGDAPGADTQFLGNDDASALRTPALAGSFETIARLVEQLSGRVWLISKAGPRIQARTLCWLDHRRFYDTTRLPRDHVRFCRKRPEKADHARALRLSHFIDDRLDVLAHLRGLVPTLVLFGARTRTAPSWAAPAPTWREVPSALGLTLDHELRP
jgi:hypothetical protein